MGSCVSLKRRSEKHSYLSKTEKLVVMPSPPVKDTAYEGAPTVSDVLNESQVSSARFSGSGSSRRDEAAFFDSQPWLESDCEEDDFVSVNGDLSTPYSRGSTHTCASSQQLLSRQEEEETIPQLVLKESLGGTEEIMENKKDASPSSNDT